MSFKTITLNQITNNSLRDFKTNPMDEKTIDIIRQSIKENGWRGSLLARKVGNKYEIAAGHHRLEAARREKLNGIQLEVDKLDDWQMFTWMRDENEAQRQVHPGMVFETVKVGAALVCQYLEESETVEAFNAKVHLAVSRNTAQNKAASEREFTKARQNVIAGEGIGRSFFEKVNKSEGHKRFGSHVVQEALDSLQSTQKEKAKRSQATLAEAEAAEADAAAKLAKSKAERERLQAEAKAAKEAAKTLRAEAERIADRAIPADILVAFETPTQMTTFSEVARKIMSGTGDYRGSKLPKLHQEDLVVLANKAVKEGWSKRQMESESTKWWYFESGAAAKDMLLSMESRAQKRFHNNDIDDVSREAMARVAEELKPLAQATEFAELLSKANRKWLRIRAESVIDTMAAFVQSLDAADQPKSTKELQKLLK